MILHEWLAFYSAVFEAPPKWCTQVLPWMAPHETFAVSAQVLCTPCTMPLHAKPHTYGVCVFSCNLPPARLAEWPGSFTCYCGNTGWNGYRNKSQHRKSTLEKKILPPLLQGFEPATFQSRVRRSNHWAVPARLVCVYYYFVLEWYQSFCWITGASCCVFVYYCFADARKI